MGTKDAPHAKLHTEANASHIRVALKDDNLGLGAKRGSGQTEGQCTGLDAFQGLLGRLNGRSEGDLEKEQKSRDALKRAVYPENRWGSVRFVSGGLLVGDKIQQLADDEAKRLQSSLLIKSDDRAGISRHPKQVAEWDKKIALKTSPVNTPHETIFSWRVSRKNDLEAEGPDRPRPVSTGDSESCDRNEVKDHIQRPLNTQPQHAALESSRPKLSDPDKKQRKAERKQRKQDKDLRRAERKSRRAKKANQDTDEVIQKHPQSGCLDDSLAILPPVAQPDTAHSLSHTVAAGGRHAIRQRYILHKKMATMDSKALNEAS